MLISPRINPEPKNDDFQKQTESPIFPIKFLFQGTWNPNGPLRFRFFRGPCPVGSDQLEISWTLGMVVWMVGPLSGASFTEYWPSGTTEGLPPEVAVSPWLPREYTKKCTKHKDDSRFVSISKNDILKKNHGCGFINWSICTLLIKTIYSIVCLYINNGKWKYVYERCRNQAID